MSSAPELHESSLDPYQNTMRELIVSNHTLALWAEMGLGKTVATLSAIEDLICCAEVDHVLIVAPKRVAATTWPDEIQKWHHLHHLTYAVAVGSKANVVKAAQKKAQITLINRENFFELVMYWKGQKAWPYDMLVIDEADSFKSHAAQKFKAAKAVRDLTPRIVELAGTPAPHSLHDLWSQVFLLDGGKRLGKNITAYRRKWFDVDYSGYRWVIKPGVENEILDSVKDICFTFRQVDYLPPREVNVITKPIVLPPNLREQYLSFERDFVTEIKGQTVAADNAGVLVGKLMQFTNGAVYTDPNEKTWEKLHDLKLQALKDIRAEHKGPLLVAYNFNHDLARLKHAIPRLRVMDDDPKTIHDWNAGKIQTLAIHPASAGHGLNIQFGGHVLVWFGLNWSLGLYDQTNARLDRRGQAHPVLIYHLVAVDTIDEDVVATLRRKGAGQKRLLEATKHRIKKHLEAA